jgi:hypothetical protein
MEQTSNLTEAAASNNRRKTLIALRDKLAATIETCESGRDIAALSKRLMEVMGELDTLPDPDSQTKNAAQLARERVRNRGASN